MADVAIPAGPHGLGGMGWIGSSGAMGCEMALAAASEPPVWGEDSITDESTDVLADWSNGQLQPSLLRQYPVGLNGSRQGEHHLEDSVLVRVPVVGGCFVPQTPFPVWSANLNHLPKLFELNSSSLPANYCLGSPLSTEYRLQQFEWNDASFPGLFDFNSGQGGGNSLSPTASTMSSTYNLRPPYSVDVALSSAQTPRRYRCQEASCPKSFQSLRNLTRHAINVHQKQRLQCGWCGAERAMREDLMKRHWRTKKCMKMRKERQAMEKWLA